MKPVLISILAAAGLVLIPPAAAQAQRWPTIRSREAAFEQRIDDGERAGALTREEAGRLRSALDDLLAREQDYVYSPPGLTRFEVQDLDARFAQLSDRLARDLADNQRGPDRNADRYGRYGQPPVGPPPTERGPDRFGEAPPGPPAADRGPDRFNGVDEGWPSMNERRDELMARIDAGVASGDLTRSEAADLRQDFEGLTRREDFYRQDGVLSSAERRDLDMAFAELTRRLRREAADDQRRAAVPAPPPPTGVVIPPPATATAPPAGDDRWRDIRNIQADLDARIDEAKEAGVVGETEAQRLHDDASDLIRLEDDYRASPPGLTRDEIADLDARIAAIEDRLNQPAPPKPQPRRDPRGVGDTTL